ncbi:MAG: Dam family site-specific DNA-(adenine-N6)-methyltransferase [Clostridia bacterium]|nr:Dam family site-specific DNA-(adenine-N6)-methyltransferase [Clostridia bacterium]
MLQYITAKEAAEKWNISQRRVSILCAENRIPDVAMLGNMWIIPRNSEKPDDARKSKSKRCSDNAHPFVKWAGGKGQLLDVLKSNLPQGIGTKITKYAEPFVGGGALLFALLNEYSFDEVYICDNNKELINTYSVIKDSCDELIQTLDDMQSKYKSYADNEEKQKYYYEQRDRYNTLILNDDSRVEKAALFIFINRTCFNGLYRVNKKGRYNVPFGKHENPTICDKENLLKISETLKNVTMRSCDYHDVVNFADQNTFVYIDPPYRPLNTTSGFTSYTEDQFNDKNQIELAEVYKKLSSVGAKVMLSNSDPHNTDENDDFFDDLYSDFNVLRVEASRMINSKASSRGKIKELLITNY